MNVCILFDTTPNAFGGANQFLKTLTAELVERGHTVTQRPNKSTQVVLLNGFNTAPGKLHKPAKLAQLRQTGKFNLLGSIMPERYWMSRRRNGPAIVHRLDGVAELARGAPGPADAIQPIVNRLCDFTIFQTDYCRTSFADHSNLIPEHFTVINNAVNGGVFHPNLGAKSSSTKDGLLKFVAVSWSANVRKGFAKLAELSLLENVQVTFAGNWAPDVPVNNVKLAGVLNSDELSDLMRGSDALIHAALNDSCANVIVEGLGSGLPVLYRDSGGNSELAGRYGIALTDDLEADIARFRDDYDDMQTRVIKDRDRFLIPRVVAEYEEYFEQAVALRGSD